MPDQWGMIYHVASGACYGECTQAQLADPAILAAKGLAFAPLGERPDMMNKQWDPATRSMAAKNPSANETLRAGLVAKPAALWTQADIASVKTLLDLMKF